MSRDRYYLTTGELPEDHPRHGELLAILSLGSPQAGDSHTTVLTLEIVANQEAAERWRAEMMLTKPWVKRQ